MDSQNRLKELWRWPWLQQDVQMLQQTGELTAELYATVLRVTEKHARWCIPHRRASFKHSACRDDAVAVVVPQIVESLKTRYVPNNSPVIAFISHVARLRLANWVRDNRVPLTEQPLALTAEPPTKECDNCVSEDDLVIACQQLLDNDRELFHCVRKGMSTANIAEHLGVTPSAIKMRMSRLIQQLRKLGI